MAPVHDFCIAKGKNLVIWFCNITPVDAEGFRNIYGKIIFFGENDSTAYRSHQRKSCF